MLNFTTTEEALCGGPLEAAGTVSSPNTNGSVFCIWEKTKEDKNTTFVLDVAGVLAPVNRTQCFTYNALSFFGDCKLILSLIFPPDGPHTKTSHTLKGHDVLHCKI